MASARSTAYRAKKWLNDMLRRLTGYQFVKAESLRALEAAAAKASPRPKGGGRPGRPGPPRSRPSGR